MGEIGHGLMVQLTKRYLSETEAPACVEVDVLSGLTLLEFGTDWCGGHCRAAQPALAEVLSQHPQWRHIKVEDRPGILVARRSSSSQSDIVSLHGYPSAFRVQALVALTGSLKTRWAPSITAPAKSPNL